MKKVLLNIDDKLYFRLKNSGYSWNEILALGIRLKQIFDIFENRAKAAPEAVTDHDQKEDYEQVV